MFAVDSGHNQRLVVVRSVMFRRLMPESGDFPELIRLARAGDEDAAARLAHEFEPFIRRFVRFRMRSRSNHDRLRPEIDSADICQSIFKSLFVGLREGRFELNRPEQLAKLLSAMVRFKVATKARRLSVTLREILELDAPGESGRFRAGPRKVGRRPGCARDDRQAVRGRMSWSSWSAGSTINRGRRSPWRWVARPRACARS